MSTRYYLNGIKCSTNCVAGQRKTHMYMTETVHLHYPGLGGWALVLVHLHAMGNHSSLSALLSLQLRKQVLVVSIKSVHSDHVV